MRKYFSVLIIGWLLLALIAPYLALIILPGGILFYLKRKYEIPLLVAIFSLLILWIILGKLLN